MHGWPALGAVARVAGHSTLARDLGQQAGEPALALVVDCARQADRRAPHAPRGKLQDGRYRAGASADRPVGRKRVGLGGGATGYIRSAGHRDQWAVAAEQCLAQCGERGALLGDRLRERLWAAEVIGEREVDDGVALSNTVTQGVQVRQGTPDGCGARCLDGMRGCLRPGECEDGVAVAKEFGDDGGADQAGAAGDEDVHGTLLEMMGHLSHHNSKVMALMSHDLAE